MSIPERMFAFEQQAERVNSRKALEAALLELIGDLGGSHFLCAYVGEDATGKSIRRSISNISMLWQETYLERGYEASDPVLQCVSRAGAYGYWDELSRSASFADKAVSVMQFAGEIGMHDGFTKRVMLDGGGVAIMMIAGAALDRSDDARSAFRLACHVFANEGARMLPASVPGLTRQGLEELSPSQKQVLQMRANGLTNLEVAAYTGTVAKTVESHVTQILRRLKARNMIDAIRKAKDLQLLN